MTEVLSQAGLPTDAAFTIREHFNFTPGAKSLAEVSEHRYPFSPLLSPSLPPPPLLLLLQVCSVRVRVDSDRVLGMLLEKAQFDVARSYANIVGSTANEVTVKEVSSVMATHLACTLNYSILCHQTKKRLLKCWNNIECGVPTLFAVF